LTQTLKKLALQLISALSVCLCCADRGFAQGARFPAVFGGSVTPNDRQAVDLSLSLAEAYDDNALATDFGVGLEPSTFQRSGVYTELISDLAYSKRGTTQVQATAGSDLRYYNELSRVVLLTGRAGVDLLSTFGRGTAVHFGQGVTYAPTSLSTLFARPLTPVDEVSTSEVLPIDGDYALLSERLVNFLTSASVDQKLTRRSVLTLSGDLSYANYVAEVSELSDLRSNSVRGQFSYQLNRSFALRSGYNYSSASYAQGARPVNQHTVDMGLNYQRSTSRSRKTTIEFTVGSTRYEVVPILDFLLEAPDVEVLPDEVGAEADTSQTTPSPNPTSVTIPTETTPQYGVTGNVAVSHDFGRTWSATGYYQRGLSYVYGLRDATFGDGVTINVQGFFNRRLDLNFQTSYSGGSFAVAGSRTPSDYKTYGGSVRARSGLGKMWATYVEYLFYYYQFDNSRELQTGLPQRLTRNAIRGGLTLWVPVMRHR
jgi:hypothetical protein